MSETCEDIYNANLLRKLTEVTEEINSLRKPNERYVQLCEKGGTLTAEILQRMRRNQEDKL